MQHINTYATSILLLILCLALSPVAKAQYNTAHTIKLGTASFFQHGYSHQFELGYYHMFDASILSLGPTISALGMIKGDGKFTIGPKVGFEANFLFFDAKLDVAYLYPGVYVHPAAGFSLFSMFGITAGYNICVNQKNASGFTVGLYYHYSPQRKHIKF